MKIPHTSDWHVGRTIRGRSRADEHRAVLAEIVDVAAHEQVDLVLVAGDQFDSAAPSPESEEIVYRALLDLVATGAQVVVLAGNHDNPRRWSAIKPLLDHTNVHTGFEVRRPRDGGVLALETAAGEHVRVALVPWLSQRRIVRADHLMRRDADEHAGAYQDRVRRIVHGLAEAFSDDSVNLVTAHLTVASGQAVLGGGERAAHTIFDYFVPPTVFPPTAHYVALGHLHQPHKLPSPAPVWYSGSPLHLDFGERPSEHKAVLVVEVSADTPAIVREVPLTAGRRLRTVRGRLDELESRRDEFGDDYLRVVLDEPLRAGLGDDVREVLPAAVDVTVGRPDPDGSDDGPESDELASLEALTGSEIELFAEYLRDRGVDDPAMTDLFRELLEEAHASDPA